MESSASIQDLDSQQSDNIINIPGKTGHQLVKKATGEVLGFSYFNSVDELTMIMKRARVAQVEWAQKKVGQRAAIIRRASSYIAKNCDQLARTISDDNGKTRADAVITELFPSAMAASYYAGKAEKFLKERLLMPGHLLLANKISRLTRVPFGVIGIISPWNYPFSIPFSEIVMGLLAGNCVILKTASETQMVGSALKELFESIGLPPHVFNYINMPGKVAGDAFLEAGVDKLFFTGSVSVGKYLMAKAAKSLTPVSLELGGNDAMVVCEDADLQRAADGAVWAGFQNAGQSCGGVERIYVHSSVYDQFLELLKTKTESLRVGYDTDFNVDIGVMTTERQMRTVQSHIDDALAKGAVIHARATLATEEKWHNVIAPLVLTGVNHEMLVMKEETFGPVLGVMKVDNMDEAVELANDSTLGLTGSVWSSDRKKALAIARRIKAGAVTVNDHLMSHGLAETPWGGFKESGIGRTHGEIGFQEMSEPQVIVEDIMPFVKRNMWWHPHDITVYHGIKGLLDMLYGSGFINRISGSASMVRLYMRTFTRGK